MTPVSQVAIRPGASGLDVRWRVRCGDHVVYGHGREELSAGYSFRSVRGLPNDLHVRLVGKQHLQARTDDGMIVHQ